jgi:hypothetical protein
VTTRLVIIMLVFICVGQLANYDTIDSSRSVCFVGQLVTYASIYMCRPVRPVGELVKKHAGRSDWFFGQLAKSIVLSVS